MCSCGYCRYVLGYASMTVSMFVVKVVVCALVVEVLLDVRNTWYSLIRTSDGCNVGSE